MWFRLVRSKYWQEFRILLTWLHEFWIFSFKTAEQWGHGPRQWTAELLAFDQYQDKSSPATPQIDAQYPLNQDAHGLPNEKKAQVTSSRPSALCHWSIHLVMNLNYDRIASPRPVAADDFDVEDESSWKPWPQNVDGDVFTERLETAPENSQFSSVEVLDLPIAATQKTRAPNDRLNSFLTRRYCSTLWPEMSTFLKIT